MKSMKLIIQSHQSRRWDEVRSPIPTYIRMQFWNRTRKREIMSTVIFRLQNYFKEEVAE